MSWLTRLLPSVSSQSEQRKGVPEGVWSKCDACSVTLYRAELARQLHVCPKCGHHHKLSARQRLEYFLDDVNYTEIASTLQTVDWLKFKDSRRYKDRLTAAKQASSENEALIAVKGRLCRLPIVVVAFEFNFIAGSMGAVVGERFVHAVNVCLKEKLPLICFSTSGGARMQEGLVSLMQMAKVSAALAKLTDHHLPFISVLLNPTTGGVSASLAMLGDVIIAEPNALIGFAGPRVIQQTVGEVLPEGFQRSEFLLKHGAIDMIVDRRHLRMRIASIVAKLIRQPEPTDTKTAIN